MNIENITSKGISLDINGQSMQKEVYEREIVKLQSNWNSLRKYIEKRIQDCKQYYPCCSEEFQHLLDKMNELESGEK